MLMAVVCPVHCQQAANNNNNKNYKNYFYKNTGDEGSHVGAATSTAAVNFHAMLNITPGASSVSSSSSPPPPLPQCLVLRGSSSDSSQDVAAKICSKSVSKSNNNNRRLTMRTLRLAFCDAYQVANVVTSDCLRSLDSSEAECTSCLAKLEALDRQARSTFCYFEELMRHFDCDTAYSTHGDCKSCQVSQRILFLSRILF